MADIEYFELKMLQEVALKFSHRMPSMEDTLNFQIIIAQNYGNLTYQYEHIKSQCNNVYNSTVF